MANLYWKNIGADNSWNNINNWFTEPEATNQAANVPWVAGDTIYLDAILYRSNDSITAEDAIYIDSDIINGVTGECAITALGGSGSFNNDTNIYSGNFTGNSMANSPPATIYGGVFTGTYFTNAGTIAGGDFSAITNFIDYDMDGRYTGGTPPSYMVSTTNLYWKNTNLNNSWNDVGNWYPTILGWGNNASNVPWVAGDSTYLGYILNRSNESINIQDVINIDADIINGVTGTCTIAYIGVGAVYINAGVNIYSGTFTGEGLDNNGIIHNGIFSGYLTYNTVSGVINGGIFTGNSFSNFATINGGIFTGLSFGHHDNAVINNGIFSGSSFYVYTNSIINSGIFCGSNFDNSQGGAINGGYWIEKGTLKVEGRVINGMYANPVPTSLETLILDSDIIGTALL